MANKTIHPKQQSKLTKRQIEDKRKTASKRADQIMKRVGDCAEGIVKMDSTELKAAGIFLAKVMPDLKSVEQTTKTEQRSPKETMAALAQHLQDNPDVAKVILSQLPQEVVLELAKTKSEETSNRTEH